ncbi:hypothetical protein CBM2634_A80160 [Cupriavidus taiwanensis]|uniref:Uncharacterized protein n=1 Tax=Cupriavidus taiwanensis TaxID=164546 RepID=A0A375J208_9BURK|nr:hypothetical protein CBM2634_A80160 [Cupriavidus taiwanensis]
MPWPQHKTGRRKNKTDAHFRGRRPEFYYTVVACPVVETGQLLVWRRGWDSNPRYRRRYA